MKSFMPLLEQNAFQNAIAQSFFLKQYLHHVSKTAPLGFEKAKRLNANKFV